MSSPGVKPQMGQIPPPEMEQPEPGLSCPYDYNGYVGPNYVNDKGRVKNKPRLSMWWTAGEYCTYPSPGFTIGTLNAKIKIDKDGHVKSIKGTMQAWWEAGSAFDDGSPMLGQFEGKFTATPYSP